MRYPGILIIFILFSCSVNKTEKETADYIIKNGTVLLPEGKMKKTDIAIKGDTIAAIGGNLEEKWKAESVIDAEGEYVMPGLIDAHAHFLGIGKSLAQVNLLETTSWQGVLDSIEKRVENADPGEWIVGRGWHQEKWYDQPKKTVKGFPVHEELSLISPENPVMLGHASGHGVLVNKKAMQVADIDEMTNSPEGGAILKDEKNRPIGIFQENAMNLIRSVYDSIRAERTAEEKKIEWEQFINLAEEECLKYGITTVHDAGISMSQAQQFYNFASANGLDLRLYSMLSEDELRKLSADSIKTFLHKTDNIKRFRMNAIKGYMDGALGSRGAWLLSDYSDEASYTGEVVTPLDTLIKSINIADQLGLQVCIHAIGDRANREVLNMYEEFGGNNLPSKRWRIEHAQHLHPDDINRFNELGVIASMQPIHCTSDAPYVIDRLGEERAESGAYIWNTLLESGAHLAFGTDAPVERVDPFANIYAAVSRKNPTMDSAFYPDEAVSREEALNIYTSGNAYAEFAEERKGEIAAGMLADIIILDTDLLRCPVEELLNATVLYTIVGGEVEYKMD